jgi:uncharacterized tellurite resistance protein B-like protein
MSEAPHEALQLTLDERVDYLAVVASIAAVDVKLQNSEKAKLRELGRALELPEDRMREVLDVAERPAGSVDDRVARLRSSDLRFTLLTDCICLAHADADFGEEEQAEIARIATALGVSGTQLAAMVEYVVAARAAAKSDDASSHQRKGEELAGKLAALGVPLGAVGAASALGLVATGASSGLAALALGFGAASGLGLVMGAGVGTFMGVRWLRKRLAG